MLDNAPVSIIVLNDKNQVQTWNTEAENTFLWNSKDMLGQNILKIVPSREQEEVEQVLSDVHKNFTVSHHQNANIRKDGKEILCEWMNAPFKGKYDNSNFVICMARDITEKKRLQQELEHAAHGIHVSCFNFIGALKIFNKRIIHGVAIQTGAVQQCQKGEVKEVAQIERIHSHRFSNQIFRSLNIVLF